MRPLVVLLVGFSVRAAIILTNPIIWGGDPVIHLFYRHDLLLGHQLPLLQLLIRGASLLSMNPALIQYLVAAIGAMAGLAFYNVVADLRGERWALPAALLFATHPLMVAVSTVPFQESLMVALLLFAFHFFYTDRVAASSLCLALACLTRFEAWAAVPVFAIAFLWRKDRSFLGALKGGLIFGCVPVAWLAAHHGLASTGHFVIDHSLSFWRLQRYVYLGWITVKFTQAPVLVLAAVGAWGLFVNRETSPIDWRWWMQIAFVSLFAISVLFSAHGVAPDPERFVTSREAHFFICFVLLMAAIGLARWPRWNRWIVPSGMLLGILGSFWYVRLETSLPDVRLDYEVARFLQRSLGAREHALLLTNPVRPDAARLFLDKARETGGEPGLRQARLELEQLMATPPDYQRVVVQSGLSREQLLSAPAGQCAEWVAVWDDYPGAARELAEGKPAQVLRSGIRSVSIVRRTCADSSGG